MSASTVVVTFAPIVVDERTVGCQRGSLLMSSSCDHAEADAARHPECGGCRASLLCDERVDRDWFYSPEEVLAAARCGAVLRPTPKRCLLDPTGNVTAEREAIAVPERPGSWFGDAGADGRMLDQDQTDLLIRSELWRRATRDLAGAVENHAELEGILGPMMQLEFDAERDKIVGHQQRGGISSDPLVRLLAFRAWGDRDRRWFEDRGVRKGEAVAFVHRANPISVCALLWPGESAIGTAVDDALPGQVVALNPGGAYTHRLRYEVSDRPRTPPADWRAERDRGHAHSDEVLIGSHGFRTGDRVQIAPAVGGGADYVVNRIDGNRFTLSTERTERGEPIDGSRDQPRRGDSRPPVPPWARDRRRRP